MLAQMFAAIRAYIPEIASATSNGIHIRIVARSKNTTYTNTVDK